MVAHIIHNPERKERRESLEYESKTQGFEYKIWEAEMHEKGHIGCLRSHKKIIQYAKDNNLPEILIMEDDVRFCGPGSFDYFLINKPPEFDLYLAGVYYIRTNSNGTLYKFSATHCYIIHKRFYDKVLAFPENDLHIDELFTGIGKYIVIKPYCAVQYPGFSDNIKGPVDYDYFLKDIPLYNGFKLQKDSNLQ